MSPVEQGFNSDIVHGGESYHVQTEDWGQAKQFIVTSVFHGGVVMLNLKTPYEKLNSMRVSTGSQAIRLGMREQHQRVLDQLVSGTLFPQSLK